MSHEDIRKLLGGYASNTLTESERRALFEAAIEDQEIYDALQQEQALKELLDDPASRQQIRRALETPAAKARANWWSQRWVWGSASAVAVGAAIFAIVLSRSPQTKPVQIASNQDVTSTLPQEKRETVAEPAAPAPIAPEQRVAEQPSPPAKALKKAAPVNAPEAAKDIAAAPAPPQAPAAETLAQRNEVQTLQRGVVGSILAPQAAQPMAAGAAAFAPDNRLRFSLLKRDAAGNFSPIAPGTALEPGDQVRLTVFAGVTGSLSLEQFDDSGAWRRIFPQAPEGIAVTANSNTEIPESGLVVKDMPQRFRIVLAPSAAGEAGRAADAARAPVTAEVTISSTRRQ
jgi:hypothetical protein